MRLGSADGPVVQLEPIGYQYPARASKVTERDWDANWLIIRGTVTPDDRRGWSFTDACLTTFEARELADWLRGVALGEVLPSPFETGSLEGLLWFTEPCLAFSVASRSGDDVTIRVHLSLEALPAGVSSKRPELYEHFVLVSTTSSGVTRAVGEWMQELAAFPVR